MNMLLASQYHTDDFIKQAGINQALGRAVATIKQHPYLSTLGLTLAAQPIVVSSSARAKQVRMRDIEDELGTQLSPSKEKEILRLSEEQAKKRLGMQHPLLTGIPTMGVAPYLSKRKAVDEIARQLLRKNPSYRESYRKAQTDRSRLKAGYLAAGIQLAAASLLLGAKQLGVPRG